MSLYPVLGFTTFGYSSFGYPGATSVCGYGFDCPTTYIETYPGVPPEDSGSVTQPTGPTSPQPADQTGNLRLDVQPVSTQIFVDGYFMGTVQDFSDTLAGLRLIAGPHHLELRAPGHEPIVLDVMIEAGRTINYRATLKALP